MLEVQLNHAIMTWVKVFRIHPEFRISMESQSALQNTPLREDPILKRDLIEENHCFIQ